ncbi:MAG: M23 family metallopeptidase [Acidimicrobiia bacterium]|nr:M23 family metallopeptidase [Acidimicrobiia bacterium]MDH5502660.1 M23 family metallopeptidase [Acidimicrobiia bacterium]
MKHILISLAIALAIVPAVSTPVNAATEYDMVFPVVGDVQFDNTWGNARSGGRRHQGTDIMAAKMLPVVAVADGVIDWVHDGTRKTCCALGITHDDGWESYYIHMNNDTPGTDDGDSWGFAPGIDEGTRVVAGQLIGWVGDSGNAEGTAPHIHFELHQPNGVKINPYHSLVAARQADVLTIGGSEPFATAQSISDSLDGAVPIGDLTAVGADSLPATAATVRVNDEMVLLLSRQGDVAESVAYLYPTAELVEFVLIEEFESIQARLEDRPPA